MDKKKKVSVVITDVDNTLYDQLHVWHKTFEAMMAELIKISGLTRDALIAGIKPIYMRHKTSEYTFLIEELKLLIGENSNVKAGNAGEVYKAAIDAYRREHETHLKLYPFVKETLEAIKDRGCKVVAYTEAQGFYAEHRLKAMGLDGVVDYLYHAPSHEMPHADANASASLHPLEYSKLERTISRATPAGVFKPSPEVLNSIIRDLGAETEEVIYVGDKKTKDVSMAISAGVTAVHAAYGEVYQKPEYGVLRQVTHWTDEEVRTEQEESARIEADVSLESFIELLVRFRLRPSREALLLTNFVEAWKKTVDVQMHFNDLGLRIRNFAITVLGALLGGAALTLKDQVRVTILNHSMPAAALLTIVAIVTWVAFYVMDRFWYHELLLGAVAHGAALEDRLSPTLPGIGLTKTIGANFTKEQSKGRMKLFYLSITGALVVLTLALAFGMGAPANAGAQNNNAGGAPPLQNTNSSNQNTPPGAPIPGSQAGGATDANRNDH